MTRIIRRVFRLAASGLCLLSLLACVGAGWLWWRSGRVYADVVEVATGWSSVNLRSEGQGLHLRAERGQSKPAGVYTRSFLTGRSEGFGDIEWVDDYVVDSGGQWLGTEYAFGSYRPRPLRHDGSRSFPDDQLPSIRSRVSYWRVLYVPHWWPITATALPPLLWSGVRVRRAWVRRRRRRMGLCLSCGYDLRGSEGRCSECGQSIVTRGAA